MDTWPAPLVLDPDAKEKMWLFLVSEPKDMSRLVDTPPDSAFFDRDAKASNGIRSYIEKRLDPDAGRRLEKVDYVDARRTFVVRFDNNKTYALALDDIAGADATEVLSWQVGEGRQYFKVMQLSGNLLEVPWDVVLYHCEPAYEYYKGRERSEESDARGAHRSEDQDTAPRKGNDQHAAGTALRDEAPEPQPPRERQACAVSGDARARGRGTRRACGAAGCPRRCDLESGVSLQNRQPGRRASP